MANKKLLAALMLTAGCATSPKVRQTGYLGMQLCPAKEGLLAAQVFPGSPAARAGVRDGDVLTSYRGLDLAQAGNRKTLLWDIRNGRRALELAIKQGGRFRFLKAVPKRKALGLKDEIANALIDEIVSGQRVSIAVVVSQINHTRPEFFKNAQALTAWKDGVKASLQSQFEDMLLNKGFLRCGNYSVVDRDKTERVLEELHFQMTGAVSPQTAKELGKMAEASHLLFIALTRFQQGPESYQDEINARLVVVESDSVLATIRSRRSVGVQ